jgi:hypothetical protein
VEPDGSLTAAGGANNVSFSYKAGSQFRAMVTIITLGDALK